MDIITERFIDWKRNLCFYKSWDFRVVCYCSKTQPQPIYTSYCCQNRDHLVHGYPFHSVQFNLDQGHYVHHDRSFFVLFCLFLVLRSKSEFIEGRCQHALLQGFMDSLSSLKSRPRWKTVHLESNGSCFPVAAWSMYTLTYLYLTEFFRSVSLAAMRGRDSPGKKWGKWAFSLWLLQVALTWGMCSWKWKSEKKNHHVFIRQE